MNYFQQRLYTDLNGAPLELMPSFLPTLAALVESDIFSLASMPQRPASQNQPYKMPVEVSPNGRHAVMRIEGPLYSSVPGHYKSLLGLVDLNDVNHDIDAMAADPKLETIVFDIDSPGGMARPSSETAEAIRELGKRKRTVAYSGPGALMASAAYKLGAACKHVLAADSADVGCVGTYLAMKDTSGEWEKAGRKLELFRDGKYKAIGHPGKAMTDDERAHLAGEVEALSKRFKAFVRENRPGIQDYALEGQTLAGRAAREAGLIDGTRRNLALVVADEIRRAL